MIPSQSRSQGARARGVGLATALVLAGSLSGCGPADTGLQRDTARQFQERVLVVSQAAAANAHAAALKTLDELESDVASAAGSGHVSGERRRSIMTSIAAVRADLEAVISAAAAAKAAEEAAAAAAKAEQAKVDAAAAKAEKVKSDAEAVAQAAEEDTAPLVQAPLPAPAPAPEPGKGNESKGNEGKGKNKKD